MKIPFSLACLLGILATCHADAVRLKIVGPDKKPVAGAKVHIVELSGLWYRPLPVATSDIQSDAAGAVALQSKKPLQKKDDDMAEMRSKSRLSAVVRAPGMAVALVFLKPGDNTLSLEKGRAFEGVVLDEAQKPLAGVHLSVTHIKGTGDASFVEGLNIAQSTSDAKGHFRFEDLPVKGQIAVEPSDAAWKREAFPLDLEKPAPPLFLERGITIKGRLLKPDGTPAGGVRFFAGDSQHQPTTRADGTFEAAGLSESSVYLQLVDRDQNLPFVVAPKQVSDLKAGEVRDIGDWKTLSGVRVKGRVVASDTKKPVPNPSISMWGRGNSQGEGDAQGAFDILAAPEASMATISGDGFVALIKPGIDATPKNGVIDLGTIELRRGKKVSGILLDETGNAVAMRSLRARKKNGNTGDNWTQTGKDGRFSFDALDAGDFTLIGEGWKFVSGDHFSVASSDAVTPELRVVVAGSSAPASTNKIQKVSGRVEAEDGTGVAGAKIALRLMTSEGGYSPQSVLSQADGTFSASFEAAGGQLKVASVRRPGFSVGQNTITPDKDGWRVVIALQPKGSALRGRVVNAAGQGVAGAFVSLSNGTDLPVATDANGDFSLPDAPRRNVTLLASNGASFTSFAVKDAASPQIALPDAAPVADKSALAETVLTGAGLGWEWTNLWDELGQKRIEALVRSAGIGDRNGGNKDWAWNSYLVEFARRDTKTFLAREEELRAMTSGSNTTTFERLLMLARATSGNDEQKESVRTFLQKQEAEKRDISASTVEKLLQLAQIGAALDAPTGALWLDYAAQIAEQIPDNGGDSAWQWGALVAQVQPDAPLSFGEDWKPSAQLMLLNSAMRTYRERGDVENARKALEKSRVLAAEAAKNPDADIKPREYGPRAADLLKQTTGAFIRVLAGSDPKAALALAPQTEEYEQVQVLNLIARSAVKLKQFDVAKQAIQAVFEVSLGNVEFVAEAAGIAQGFDPAFAETLWPRAYAKARPRSEDELPSYASFAPFAGARAPFNPGQSRVLIEREWAARLAVPAKPADDPNSFDDRGQRLSALVGAMAKVDPARALEMLEQVPQTNNLRSKTRTDIAVALLKP